MRTAKVFCEKSIIKICTVCKYYTRYTPLPLPFFSTHRVRDSRLEAASVNVNDVVDDVLSSKLSAHSHATNKFIQKTQIRRASNGCVCVCTTMSYPVDSVN